jgi:hypothetical protein
MAPTCPALKEVNMVTTLRCSDCQAIFTRTADLEEHRQIAHQQHPEGIGEVSGHMGALSGQTAHDLSGGMPRPHRPLALHRLRQ